MDYVDGIRQLKSEILNGDLDFTSTPYADLVDESKLLQNRKLVSLNEPNPILSLFGPKVENGITDESIQIIGNRVAARTVSTYPTMTFGDSNIRDGDPIADRYAFYEYSNRIVIAIADGCNWGDRYKKAADRARSSTMSYLKEKRSKMLTVGDASLYLLRAFNHAHNCICEKIDPDEQIGSTTLLAGMSLEIEGEDGGDSEWVFVCTSVGDPKAFLIRDESKEIFDITINNPFNGFRSPTDRGGKLGPVQPGGGPDLRNLYSVCYRVSPGDIIFSISSGVYNNLHPGNINITPKDLKVDDSEIWSPSLKEPANRFSVNYLRRIFKGIEFTPENIVKTLIDYCVNLTKPSREFMETQPGKGLPKDIGLYPGKMDHSTCIAHCIGSANFLNKREEIRYDAKKRPSIVHSGRYAPVDVDDSVYIPISIAIVCTEDNLTIYCRTIVKGELHCIVTNTHTLLLKITPRKSFVVPKNEKHIGKDPIDFNLTRTIDIPDSVEINVDSKQILYENGLILIRFDLVK